MQNAVSLSQAVTHEIPFRRLWLAPQSLVFFVTSTLMLMRILLILSGVLCR